MSVIRQLLEGARSVDDWSSIQPKITVQTSYSEEEVNTLVQIVYDYTTIASIPHHKAAANLVQSIVDSEKPPPQFMPKLLELMKTDLTSCHYCPETHKEHEPYLRENVLALGELVVSQARTQDIDEARLKVHGAMETRGSGINMRAMGALLLMGELFDRDLIPGHVVLECFVALVDQDQKILLTIFPISCFFNRYGLKLTQYVMGRSNTEQMEYERIIQKLKNVSKPQSLANKKHKYLAWLIWFNYQELRKQLPGPQLFQDDQSAPESNYESAFLPDFVVKKHLTDKISLIQDMLPSMPREGTSAVSKIILETSFDEADLHQLVRVIYNHVIVTELFYCTKTADLVQSIALSDKRHPEFIPKLLDLMETDMTPPFDGPNSQKTYMKTLKERLLDLGTLINSGAPHVDISRAKEKVDEVLEFRDFWIPVRTQKTLLFMGDLLTRDLVPGSLALKCFVSLIHQDFKVSYTIFSIDVFFKEYRFALSRYVKGRCIHEIGPYAEAWSRLDKLCRPNSRSCEEIRGAFSFWKRYHQLMTETSQSREVPKRKIENDSN